MTVPASIDHVTDAWLSSALGQAVSITSVERIGEGYGLASEIHRVSIEGHEEPTIVLKLWSFDGPADATEIHFYAELAPMLDGPLPRCFSSAMDETHAALVLEDLHGRQGDVLIQEEPSILESIARSLGTLHAQWWGHDLLRRLGWLRDGTRGRDAAWTADRRHRYEERHGRFDSRLANDLIRKADVALQVGTERLGRLPPTLVHGDLHLDNYLFVEDRPVLLDWAGCRRGPGVQDLAAVVFGMGASDGVDALLDAYARALADNGVRIARLDLHGVMGGAVLWSFVYWTLGTAMWIPEDDRGAAMQRKHIADAVRMVEYWAERDPELLDAVLG